MNISVNSNLSSKLLKVIKKLSTALNETNISQAMAVAILPEVQHRIHLEGKASDGTLISAKGYTPRYLALRQKKYNRTSDRKVILSLTRQMENDFVADVGSDGKWGLGWNNILNSNKMEWMEELFGKKISNLTEKEKDLVLLAAQEFINRNLSNTTNA